MYRADPCRWSPKSPSLTSGMRLFPLLLLGCLGRTAAAQARPEVSAEATIVFHQASVTPTGRGQGEVKVVRPVMMAHWRFASGLAARATLNLEGATMPAGELLPGGWGEGFVDRRHPHTYAHELILEGRHEFVCSGTMRCAVGGFIGKGFVPFGSADPMMRGFLRYPVNHHLAQVLERAVIGGQIRTGPATVEMALFNGDEPEKAGQWPRIGGRFGDSWAARVSIRPVPRLEASASFATVRSPEHRPGAGATQRKRHAAVGYDGPLGSGRFRVLAEIAETAELDRFFVFGSRLAEAEYHRGRMTVRYRYEDTDRPEEERLSPFRSARPHLENSILGETRWRTHSAGATFRLRGRDRLGLEWIVEGTAGRVNRRGAGIFDPLAIYGRTSVAVASTGVRFAWRRPEPRMGVYGIAGETAGHAH